MTRLRWSADGPVIVLALVASAMILALGASLLRHAIPYDPLVNCDTPQATLLARLGTLGLIVPAALLAQVVLATVLALGHQLWVTRRILRQVLAKRRPVNPRLTRLADRCGLTGRLDLVEDPAVYTFCHGLLRPRVCVSTGLVAMLDEAELAAVLRHEAHHRQHRDPVKILISRALSSGLFFLPLAGALHDAYLAAKELCADADAAPDGNELPLARALVKMLRSQRPQWPAGVLAVGSLTPTEARLRQLLEPGSTAWTRPTASDWLLSAAIVAGIFGFSHGAAVAADVAPVQAECTSVTWRLPATKSVGLPVLTMGADNGEAPGQVNRPQVSRPIAAENG